MNTHSIQFEERGVFRVPGMVALVSKNETSPVINL